MTDLIGRGVPATDIVVARDPSRAAHLEARGVGVRTGDDERLAPLATAG